MKSTDRMIEALFHGKSNIPNAARVAGVSIEDIKKELEVFISKHDVEDWSLDIQVCWPYNT